MEKIIAKTCIMKGSNYCVINSKMKNYQKVNCKFIIIRWTKITEITAISKFITLY